MKTLLFICFIICPCTILSAQDNYSYADSKALQIPKSKTYSTDSISGYIKDNFTTAGEKTRAVYTWITNNIEYSKDSMYHFRNWGDDPEITMTAILRRRKGVCENYANLFANILDKCGIRAVSITGFTKTNGFVNHTGHGWAAVLVNNQWLLCDPTWDAGYNSYNYFLISPSEFINTHMPFDPLWQLLDHPITNIEFEKGFYHSKKDQPVFYYSDSVTAYLQSDTMQQVEATSRRMKTAGIVNEDLQVWYAYNQMKVNIVYQEENMRLFNEAVADLNSAKKLFNEFAGYRNNHFKPGRKDEDIKAMFSNIEILLSSSYKKMNSVGKKAENYQYDTDGLKDNLDNFSIKVKGQEEFLQQYFTSAETERQKLLYK